jgi:hypothetical protein
MRTVLWLLGALGLLGAFDTIYFHEMLGQLPARLPGLGPELKLPGERATHTIMAIIYGAMLANLIPVLLAWHRSATGLHPEPVNVPLFYRLALAALALGTCASAVRDTYAVAGFPRGTARWPWPKPSRPQPSSPVGGTR